MRKRSISFFVFLAIVLLLAPVSNVNAKVIQKDQVPQYKEKKVSKNTDTLKLSVVYPIIGVKAIDDDIKRYIDSMIADFGPGEKSEHWKYELFTTYKISRYKGDYLSVRFYNYHFTGGAHGGEDVSFFTYNLKSGKKITYKDIFDAKYDYLKVFWQNAEPQLSVKLKKMEILNDQDEFGKNMLREGSRPNVDNYENFYLTDEGIMIYFGQYQVAPYVAGTFEIPIKWSKVKNGLKKI